MNCKHETAVKVENGYVITYCTKCGKILDTKPVSGSKNEHYIQSNYPDNGGQILHD